MAKKRKNLDMDLITSLREMGLTWTQIQQHPEVAASKRTISRWRQRENFVEPRQRVSDDQLDAQVAYHIEGQPRRGEVTIAASITISGFISSSKTAITGQYTPRRSRRCIRAFTQSNQTSSLSFSWPPS